jgi:hypothetical protein
VVISADLGAATMPEFATFFAVLVSAVAGILAFDAMAVRYGTDSRPGNDDQPRRQI